MQPIIIRINMRIEVKCIYSEVRRIECSSEGENNAWKYDAKSCMFMQSKIIRIKMRSLVNRMCIVNYRSDIHPKSTAHRMLSAFEQHRMFLASDCNRMRMQMNQIRCFENVSKQDKNRIWEILRQIRWTSDWLVGCCMTSYLYTCIPARRFTALEISH